MSKPKYRIITKFPCYNGVFPITGYFVQRLEEGWLRDKWIDIKGFDRYEDAKGLLERRNKKLIHQISRTILHVHIPTRKVIISYTP